MNDVPHTQLQQLPAAASAAAIDASQPPPLSPTTVVQVPPKKALTGPARQKRRQLNTCKTCGSKMTFRQVGANKVLVFCSSRNVINR